MLQLKSFKNKISLFLISCLIFSLSINGILNYFNFEQSYNDAIHSNFSIIAEDAVETIESGLDMGLKPEEMKNIQEILNSECANNSSIEFIAVLNSNKNILYKAGFADNSIDILEWQNNAINDEKINKEKIICKSIQNSFKINVGYLILIYSKKFTIGPIKKMAAFLFKLFIIALTIISIIIIFGVSIIFSNLVKNFKKMNYSIKNHLINENSIKEDEMGISHQVDKFTNISEEILKELSVIEDEMSKDNVE